jgi:putative endonuclease
MGFFHRINKFLAPDRTGDDGTRPVSRTAHGSAAEAAAVAWLQRQGLQLLMRNYKTPGRGGGEIDAIMRAADGTLVFVEVRVRANSRHGGAATSIGSIKQRRIIHAAQQYLQRFPAMPPCRFDVMACDQPGPPWQWTWIVAAFDAA